MQNIYLCGFMGCGKTTIGKAAAQLMNMTFIDLDDYIQDNQQKSIPRLFEQYGEVGFRQFETQALSALSGQTNCIIATGGGTMVGAENAQIAKQNGCVVFLDVPFSLCYNRIKTDTNRPIAHNNARATLEQIYNMRILSYRNHADHIIDATRSCTVCALDIQTLIK